MPVPCWQLRAFRQLCRGDRSQTLGSNTILTPVFFNPGSDRPGELPNTGEISFPLVWDGEQEPASLLSKLPRDSEAQLGREAPICADGSQAHRPSALGEFLPSILVTIPPGM